MKNAITVLCFILILAGLSISPTAESEAELLARLLYAECRGESDEGRLAVAQCVLDRVSTDHRDFRRQDTIRKVITAKNQFAKPGELTDELLDVAKRAIAGERAFPDHEVLFFRATKSTDDWWDKYIGHIGRHAFFGRERIKND